MPQLMPLNWMFSSSMLVILILMSSVVFSMTLGSEVQIIVDKKSNSGNMWCW